MYVYFFPTHNCRDHQVYIQCYYAYSYHVGPPANAGIKYKAKKGFNIHSFYEGRKILELIICKTFHIYL